MRLMAPRAPIGHLFLCACLFALAEAPAQAQGTAPNTPSSWGFTVSVTPRWVFPRALLQSVRRDIDMRGLEITAGLVKGGDRRGDWGVTFVMKTFNDGSTIAMAKVPDCVDTPAGPRCARGGFRETAGARAYGAEIHWFFPIVNRGSTQVGLTVGGGIAAFSGNTRDGFEHLQVPAGSSTPVVVRESGTATQPFSQTMHEAFPLWGLKLLPAMRAEVTVALRLSRSMKLKVGSGLSLMAGGIQYVRVAIQRLFR